MNLNIISLGEVLWDLLPRGERLGGAPANFACHAAIQGAKLTLVSAVGNDRRGKKAIGILRDYGVETSFIETIPGEATGAVDVTIDLNGQPTFAVHKDSAWDKVTWTDQLASRVTQMDAIYFGILGQRSEPSRSTIRRALEAAAEAGIRRILDVNLRSPFFDVAMIRESVMSAGILKLSDDELDHVAEAFEIPSGKDDEETLRRIRDKSDLELIVMTRGAKGAMLLSTDETIVQPGVPVDVNDSVGAGDAFTATLVIGVLQGDDYQKVLSRACEVAAQVCGISGAVPPTEIN